MNYRNVTTDVCFSTIIPRHLSRTFLSSRLVVIFINFAAAFPWLHSGIPVTTQRHSHDFAPSSEPFLAISRQHGRFVVVPRLGRWIMRFALRVVCRCGRGGGQPPERFVVRCTVERPGDQPDQGRPGGGWAITAAGSSCPEFGRQGFR